MAEVEKIEATQAVEAVEAADKGHPLQCLKLMNIQTYAQTALKSLNR